METTLTNPEVFSSKLTKLQDSNDPVK